MVAELGDVTVAAIASADTAALYGLEILEPGINGHRSNEAFLPDSLYVLFRKLARKVPGDKIHNPES